MKKWFFNFMAGLSLLLCLATAGLWVRSYWRFDRVWYLGPPAESRIIDEMSSQKGSVGASYSHGNRGEVLAITSRFILISQEADAGVTTNMMEGLEGWYCFGFGYVNYMSPPLRVMIVMIPHWLLLLLLLVLPTMRFARFRRQRNRLRKGLCLRCGYDLRASPERCPECGMPVPTGVEE